MKVAYLIMAHTDASQLGRLIAALSVGDITDFYIHIDLKSDMSLFEEKVPDVSSEIKFIKNRIYTTWGGYSQVRAYHNLVNECVDSGKDYDRVCLLSGMDYPLWSNREILNFFKNNPELELMKGRNITHDSKKIVRCTSYYLFNDMKASAQTRRILRGITSILLNAIHLRKDAYVYTNGKNNDIYYASTWWCLTGKCIKYLYEQLKNKDWERYFKHSMCSDELVPATIIYNSDFGKNAIAWNDGEPKGLVGVTYSHYIEYDTHIHIYDENDFDKLIDSKKMFVRKLTSDKSLRLIKMIDDYRNSK